MKPKIQALLDQIHSGKMQTSKAWILNYIMRHPGSNKVQIEKALRLPHQTVTARLSDLEDIGLIEAKGDGQYSNFYFISDPQGQKLHRAKRAAEKLEAWAKKGMGLDITPELKASLQHLISPQDVQGQG